MHKIQLIINNGDKKKAQIQLIKKKAGKEESETNQMCNKQKFGKVLDSN